jgi:hypothetical protein
MFSNILCQHCAGKRTLEDAEAIATDIAQDIHLKIGEVSGSGVLPIPASPTLQLFIYGGYCGVKADDRPIKIVEESKWKRISTGHTEQNHTQIGFDEAGDLIDIEKDSK